MICDHTKDIKLYFHWTNAADNGYSIFCSDCKRWKYIPTAWRIPPKPVGFIFR
jgi:hypothetical protein